MTYRQWEKAFRKRLSRLPGEERERALGYYAELYGDKLDAGVSESEIVREFGDPKAAADKIIEESAETASAQGKTVRADDGGYPLFQRRAHRLYQRDEGAARGLRCFFRRHGRVY